METHTKECKMKIQTVNLVFDIPVIVQLNTKIATTIHPPNTNFHVQSSQHFDMRGGVSNKLVKILALEMEGLQHQNKMIFFESWTNSLTERSDVQKILLNIKNISEYKMCYKWLLDKSPFIKV